MTIKSSDGVHMLDAIEWDATLADLIIYCDASLDGLGFVAPLLKTSFCGSIPTDCHIQTYLLFQVTLSHVSHPMGIQSQTTHSMPVDLH